MSRTAYWKSKEAIEKDPEAPLRRIFANAIAYGSVLSNPELFKRTLAALERLKDLETAALLK